MKWVLLLLIISLYSFLLGMYLSSTFFFATEMTFNLVNYQGKEALICSLTLEMFFFFFQLMITWSADSELNRTTFNYKQECY